MPQNLSRRKEPVVASGTCREEAQALLRQLMAIYDVKTLVAFLLAVGDRTGARRS
jgi:DNA (cytosine-5)-methyltransferase 1